jgi:hypothetical protein
MPQNLPPFNEEIFHEEVGLTTPMASVSFKKRIYPSFSSYMTGFIPVNDENPPLPPFRKGGLGGFEIYSLTKSGDPDESDDKKDCS